MARWLWWIKRGCLLVLLALVGLILVALFAKKTVLTHRQTAILSPDLFKNALSLSPNDHNSDSKDELVSRKPHGIYSWVPNGGVLGGKAARSDVLSKGGLSNKVTLSAHVEGGVASAETTNDNSENKTAIAHMYRCLPDACNDVMKTTNTSSNRFVLGWLYFEQLTMATTNLFTLLWFSRGWQARAVMPFTYSSRMFGLPRLRTRQKLVRLHPLSLLYDIRKLDELSCKYKLPPMAEFKEFVNKASRHLVVMHFMCYNDDLTRFAGIGGSRKELLAALHNRHMIECCDIPYISRIINSLAVTLTRETQLAGKAPFQVHRCLCVNASLPNEPKDLLKMAGLQEEEEFSVIFNDWRGLSNSATPKKAPQGILKNFRMLVPSSKVNLWPHPSHAVFPISSSVHGNATRLLKEATGGKEFIAIHFRSEKLGHVDARIPKFVNTCFGKAMQLRDEILSKDIDSELVTLYFTDYGAYGSNTCHNSCRGATKLNSQFSAHSLTVTHFSPQKVNAVPDSGFVALVEQEAVASAHTLILVGGGSFQTQVRQRFKKYRPKGVVYAVCWDDSASYHRM